MAYCGATRPSAPPGTLAAMNDRLASVSRLLATDADGSLSTPLLGRLHGVLLCTSLTVAYVGLLYLGSRTRIGHRRALDRDGKPILDKDHEEVVRARLKVASATTAFSLLVTAYTISRALARRTRLVVAAEKTPAWYQDLLPLKQVSPTLALLGLPLPCLTLPTLDSLSTTTTTADLLSRLACVSRVLAPCLALPLCLTALFYLGPLLEARLEERWPDQRRFDFARDVRAKWDNVWGVRNFIAGPITEELVFRSCIFSLTFLSGASRTQAVLLSPAYFAIAHAHHAWETFVKEGRTRQALVRALVGAAVQTTYTGLFGWYANLLFLRSGSVLPPLLAHVFCNVMGLPLPSLPAGGPSSAPQHEQRRLARWRPVVLAAFPVGFVSFALALPVLTQRERFGGISPYYFHHAP